MTDRRNGPPGRRDDDDLTGRVVRLEDGVGLILDGLLGPEELQMNGSTIRNGGLVQDVQDLKTNGVRLRLPWGRLSAAFIIAVGSIVAAILT